ncbi:MAG: DUF3253 domain-containing protein [Cyclobacteriaceae bacterium]
MEFLEENILNLAILEMAKRKNGASFCPSEVVRWIYPADWQFFMGDVNEAMMDLYRGGWINVTQKDKAIDPNFLPQGPVKIKLK